ncbi:MAG: c-type cytochrome [Usitatibacter sp.]
MSPHTPARFVAVLLLTAFVAPGEAAERTATARVVADRGCTVCHREAPDARAAGDAPPLAPTWLEIATRYRADAAAQARLVRVVLKGADPGPPHWKGRLEFNSMGGNAPSMTAAQARDVVRWILSTR